jgi:hypothetical protein
MNWRGQPAAQVTAARQVQLRLDGDASLAE